MTTTLANWPLILFVSNVVLVVASKTNKIGNRSALGWDYFKGTWHLKDVRRSSRARGWTGGRQVPTKGRIPDVCLTSASFQSGFPCCSSLIAQLTISLFLYSRKQLGLKLVSLSPLSTPQGEGENGPAGPWVYIVPPTYTQGVRATGFKHSFGTTLRCQAQSENTVTMNWEDKPKR